MKRFLSMAISVALIGAMSVGVAFATNGYFSNGYGVHQKGLAGAGVSLPLSGLESINNPGAMVFLGNRYDVDLALFSPSRSYTITGNPTGAPGTFGLMPGTFESDNGSFFIPAAAGTWMLGEKMAFGFSGFGNGGMNTSYATAAFHGTPTTGVDLAQLFVTGTFAYRLAEDHGIGVTPIFAYQRFKAEGLEAFSMFSSDATKLTNKGYADSFGGGFSVGYLGRLTNYLSVGATYKSQVWMTKFDRYGGLYANEGSFNIPSSWTAGVAVSPHHAWTLALDVQEIRYEDCDAVCQPMLPNLMAAPLGAEDGAGFGWQNILVFKSGVQWERNNKQAYRFGYSIGEQPIPESEVMFNILAPGVMEQHVTLGMTYGFTERNAVSFAIMHAFSNQVEGANPMEAPGAQTIELEMSQWEFTMGVSF